MTHDHDHEEHRATDLNMFRQRLAQKKGKDYWRSLSELANSDEFDEVVRQEFPRQASLLDSLSRRDFLKVVGASLALAGLTACVPQSNEKIMPYAKPPEQLVPAKSSYFASAVLHDGYAKGVLVETTMGRPIKVEGNPTHPQSLGASDVFMQAAILDLYDPDRPKQVMNQGAAKQWSDFAAAVANLAGNVRILSGPVTSPTLIDQMNAVLAKFPGSKWYQYSPVGFGNSQAGAAAAFGPGFEAVYDFSKADVVLSLDSDFLFAEPGSVRYARDFAQRHQPISANGVMNRLYVVESSATITGAYADHRLAIKPSQVDAFARALANQLGVNNGGGQAGSVPGQEWLAPLAADLKKAGPAALVIAGERQPAIVHAFALAINQALGSIGNTVKIIPANTANPADPNAALKALAGELNAGGVDALVILDGNPAYASPADLAFGEAIKKAKQVIYLGYHNDETAALATWFVPAAHTMEMWGDARAYDGTVSIIQPVIEPLYGSKSAHELLAALLGQGNAKGYDLVRAYWQKNLQGGKFDADWRTALSKGVLPAGAGQAAGGAGGAAAPTFNFDPATLNATPAPAAEGELEIVFEPDYTVWDGRFANNAWLQELPKPLSKLTWDNAAMMNEKTAAKLGVVINSMVDLTLDGRKVTAPVYIQPDQPDDVVVVSLGYGRTQGGSVLAGTGFNAYAIRTSANPWFARGLTVSKAAGTYDLAATHEHFAMENRDLIREASLQEFQADQKFAQHMDEKPPTLYGEDEYPGYAWGMSINLNTCIGCNACVVACQSENNIPTVGKDQVKRGREMHWLRIDRYYKGSSGKARVAAFQPVPCMHCEKAPCEPVCPVEATSHSAEGLNEMTYNRCVGTRYCSNNCPYKVRRFNFYKYVDENVASLKAMRNPDVTVRSRGVMEKCTYCVQRITTVRIQAEVEGRKIEEGEIKTACQQACPTNAIVFGDINNTESAVRKLKETPLNYALLDELGTRPRTTYMARVTNPNPSIPEQA